MHFLYVFTLSVTLIFGPALNGLAQDASVQTSKGSATNKEQAKKKFAKALTLDHRRDVLPIQWKNQHIKMTVGQDISILLPNIAIQPNQFLISREIVEFHSSQPVVPVIVRTPVAGNVARFKAYSPGREVVSISYIQNGGGIDLREYCVLSFEVTGSQEDWQFTKELDVRFKKVKPLQRFHKLTADDNEGFVEIGRIHDTLYDEKTRDNGLYRMATYDAYRAIGPELAKWLKKPSRPRYTFYQAAGATCNPDLRVMLKQVVEKKPKGRPSGDFNTALMAYAQLANAESVELVKSYEGTQVPAQFVERALWISTWNRFLEDSAPKHCFQGNYAGQGSILEGWKTWWTGTGRDLNWNQIETKTR